MLIMDILNSVSIETSHLLELCQMTILHVILQIFSVLVLYFALTPEYLSSWQVLMQGLPGAESVVHCLAHHICRH